MKMILNPWDIQSKHIHTADGTASALYAGECRYGGGEMYVLVERNDLSECDRLIDGKQPSRKLLRTGRI